jgi:hypothetical protein
MKQNGYGVPDINTPHPKIKTDCKAQWKDKELYHESDSDFYRQFTLWGI